MTEKFVLQEHCIPDGILHDQDLYEIKLENNELTLSFEVHYYPQDYTNTSFAEKYKDFTKCHIKCKLSDEKYYESEVVLESSKDKKNIWKIKRIYMPISEFAEIANKEMEYRKKKGYWSWEYLDTSVSPNCWVALIDIRIWLKYKGTTYTTCSFKLNTEEIEFIWE